MSDTNTTATVAPAGMAGHVLAPAATRTRRGGGPARVDGRVPTPHKAVGRVAGHLIDPLAEPEARPAGERTQPGHWHACAIAAEADRAPFPQKDSAGAGARSRPARRARIRADRLGALTDEQPDRSPGEGRGFREPAPHLAGSAYRADAAGGLS
ncbi:hypothetical protein [Streptomyces sp. NPDC047725]|uniref:hypothetical protein n=1 Tax=Streptomyces sp. NPDC047725 TaxID=3365487 RepID=UPI00370FD492